MTTNTATQSIHEYLAENKVLVESHLKSLVTGEGDLHDAARYALFIGGKRLRPILVLAVTEALGHSVSKALAPAAAIEMIHSYSLIHDDLPCMDDDDYRRGALTVHKAYDEGMALLAGDYLLTKAFGVISRAPKLSAEQKIDLMTALSRDAGGRGMIGGQALDIKESHEPLNLKDLETIYTMKTGALFQSALEFGAIISEAPLKTRNALRSFAYAIGLAFQIIDDVIDVTASVEKHGKALASDQINNKTTAISFLDKNEARDYAKALLENGKKALSIVDGNCERLIEIANLLVDREI
jgi:geranylgeranyl diphosphate synthase type II